MKCGGNSAGGANHGLFLAVTQVLLKLPHVVVTQVGDGEQKQRQHHKLKANRKAKSHDFNTQPCYLALVHKLVYSPYHIAP